MILATSCRVEAGIPVLDLCGNLTLGEGCQQFRDAVSELLDHGSKRILLNFRAVERIDSLGLGELTRAFTAAGGKMATLKLVSLSPRALELLRITRLDTVFEIYDDEDSALASCR
jgi:anti-sigma B factor antagonist